jgi:hypothetical protein
VILGRVELREQPKDDMDVSASRRTRIPCNPLGGFCSSPIHEPTKMPNLPVFATNHASNRDISERPDPECKNGGAVTNFCESASKIFGREIHLSTDEVNPWISTGSIRKRRSRHMTEIENLDGNAPVRWSAIDNSWRQELDDRQVEREFCRRNLNDPLHTSSFKNEGQRLRPFPRSARLQGEHRSDSGKQALQRVALEAMCNAGTDLTTRIVQRPRSIEPVGIGVFSRQPVSRTAVDALADDSAVPALLGAQRDGRIHV